MGLSNEQLIKGIQKGDIGAFEELYSQYYTYLCLVAEHIVRNSTEAEEIVSDVFIRLWNIRERVDIDFSIRGYLVKAVHNTALNYVEKSRMIHNLTDSLSNSDFELLAWDSDYPLGQLYEKEIIVIFEHAISTLPDRCREIFMLSRNQNLKYSDIACRLDISVNTVKTQMKIAIAHLRENLKEYLMILLLFIVI